MQKGDSSQHSVSITLEMLYTGAEHPVSITRRVVCRGSPAAAGNCKLPLRVESAGSNGRRSSKLIGFILFAVKLKTIDFDKNSRAAKDFGLMATPRVFRGIPPWTPVRRTLPCRFGTPRRGAGAIRTRTSASLATNAPTRSPRGWCDLGCLTLSDAKRSARAHTQITAQAKFKCTILSHSLGF